MRRTILTALPVFLRLPTADEVRRRHSWLSKIYDIPSASNENARMLGLESKLSGILKLYTAVGQNCHTSVCDWKDALQFGIRICRTSSTWARHSARIRASSGGTVASSPTALNGTTPCSAHKLTAC